MLHYCFRYASLIARPQQADPVYTVSLDAARDGGKPLSQRLSNTESSAVEKQHDYAVLYQAVELLPPQYCEVVSCYFGLYGRRPESLYTLSRRMSANVKGTIAYLMMYRALQRLRIMLLRGGITHPEEIVHTKQQAL